MVSCDPLQVPAVVPGFPRLLYPADTVSITLNLYTLYYINIIMSTYLCNVFSICASIT